MSTFRFVRAVIAVTVASTLTAAFVAGGPQSVLPDFRADDTMSDISHAVDLSGRRHAKVATLFLASNADAANADWSGTATAEDRQAAALAKQVAAKEYPATSVTAEQLAGDIQKQLKRLGCYFGAPTGDWDAPTRAAMSLALAGLNAKLSVHNADVALLALLSSRSDDLCRQGGPTKHPETIAGGPSQRAPLPGMMSVGGPDVAAATKTGTTSANLMQAQEATAATGTGQPPVRPRADQARRRPAAPRHADTFFTHPLNRQP